MRQATGPDYHRDRAAAEFELARQCGNPDAAQLHIELGELHLQRLSELDGAEPASPRRKLSLAWNP